MCDLLANFRRNPLFNQLMKYAKHDWSLLFIIAFYFSYLFYFEYVIIQIRKAVIMDNFKAKIAPYLGTFQNPKQLEIDFF